MMTDEQMKEVRRKCGELMLICIDHNVMPLAMLAISDKRIEFFGLNETPFDKVIPYLEMILDDMRRRVKETNKFKDNAGN